MSDKAKPCPTFIQIAYTYIVDFTFFFCYYLGYAFCAIFSCMKFYILCKKRTVAVVIYKFPSSAIYA